MKHVVKSLWRLLVRYTGGSAGAHITRYWMYQRLAQVFAGIPVDGADRTLSISRSHNLCAALGLDGTQVEETDFPDVDILHLPFPDHSFDFVVSDQVLEHVEGDPAAAMAETVRVLRPGGVLVHTTCLVNPVHDPPDLWRFTPEGLRLLASGTEVVECGGWGNRAALVAIWAGLRFVPVPHAPWHPLHVLAARNHPAWPISTWVVARRPG